ncbi:MAG: hypothetical protein ACTSSK_18530 [Candidatus Heimdallarchaeota archaeon]
MATSLFNNERKNNMYYWLYYIVFGPMKVFGKLKRVIFHFDDLCDCAGDVAEVAADTAGESNKQKSSSGLCCCCDCCCEIC